VHSTTARSIGGSRQVTLDGAGLATTVVEEPNGTITSTGPDGTVVTLAQGSDPRFGMQVPIMSRMTARTPGGLLATITSGRRTILANPADPASVVSQVDSALLNGRKFRHTYVASTRTSTAVTPMGRSTSGRLDEFGRLLEESMPEFTSLQYQYDSRGRLAQSAQGTRTWTYAYGDQGLLSTATDPLTRIAQYFYDSTGRITRQVMPDDREVLHSYDALGNLQSVTPPGRPSHQFQRNALGLVTSYNPPSLGAGTWNTTYQYDADRNLTQVARPSGDTLKYAYDSAGRPSTVTLPNGVIAYNFNPSTGTLTGLTGPYQANLSFAYDGSLLKAVTWTGVIAGAVSATHNNDFQITGLSVNGGPAVGFTYDADGLLTQAGDITLNRNLANGSLTGTSVGVVVTSQSYTPFGELSHQTANVGGVGMLDFLYTHDALGRISELTETLSGVSKAKAYTYDLAGRLTEVRENGALRAVYEYDSNGNRVRVTRPTGVETGVYDQQDRMLSYGAASYTYTRSGELSTKTIGSDVTSYAYDIFGNLQRVTLPNGTVLEYVMDAMNRRVGKKVNGVLTQGWLYEGELTPVAELDGVGNVVSRFVYGSKANVPDYMVRDNITYRILSDHLGSVRLVIDANSGNVAQRIDYDEWGKVAENSNPAFQPFGFAGGLYDIQTKLVRFGARDYDAETGRWTLQDPIGLAGGVNLYGFAGGDPVNFTDPFGLCRVRVGWKKALGPFQHSFIEMTPPGEAMASVYRGGPTERGSGVVSGKEGSLSGPGGSAANGEGFGAIHAVRWNRCGFQDYDTREASSYDDPLVDDDGPCDKYAKSFKNTIERINAADIPYNLFTQNSNSVANQLLSDAGLGGLRPTRRAPAGQTVLLK
jgi:RHS repeat-associated protein